MIRVIDERIRRKLAAIRLAFRGVVNLVNAAGSVQMVQLEGLKDENLQGIEMFQQFGVTSNPPKGTMAIILPLSGKTGTSVVIATEHGDYRLKNLESGEAALYNQWGDCVVLKKNRRMQLISSVGVDIDAPETTTSGDLKVAGNIVAQGDVSDHGNKSMAQMRTVFNTHTQAVSGGTAAAPVGGM